MAEVTVDERGGVHVDCGTFIVRMTRVLACAYPGCFTRYMLPDGWAVPEGVECFCPIHWGGPEEANSE